MTTIDPTELRPHRSGSDRRPGTGSGRPRSESRSRRELVTWVALGLLVAIVLTILSRTAVAPARDAQQTPPRHRTHAPSIEASSTGHPLAAGQIATTQARPGSPTDRGRGPTVPTSTTPTTTTSIARTRPTITTVPATNPTVPGPLQYSGSLSYPSDVATSIPFSSPSGVAATRITWPGGDELVASLRCRGAHDSAPGTHGISISIDGFPGGCVVTVALGPGDRSRVNYAITVLVPSAGR
jgi:hypothetical protein